MLMKLMEKSFQPEIGHLTRWHCFNRGIANGLEISGNGMEVITSLWGLKINVKKMKFLDIWNIIFNTVCCPVVLKIIIYNSILPARIFQQLLDVNVIRLCSTTFAVLLE